MYNKNMVKKEETSTQELLHQLNIELMEIAQKVYQDPKVVNSPKSPTALFLQDHPNIIPNNALDWDRVDWCLPGTIIQSTASEIEELSKSEVIIEGSLPAEIFTPKYYLVLQPRIFNLTKRKTIQPMRIKHLSQVPDTKLVQFTDIDLQLTMTDPRTISTLN